MQTESRQRSRSSSRRSLSASAQASRCDSSIYPDILDVNAVSEAIIESFQRKERLLTAKGDVSLTAPIGASFCCPRRCSWRATSFHPEVFLSRMRAQVIRSSPYPSSASCFLNCMAAFMHSHQPRML